MKNDDLNVNNYFKITNNLAEKKTEIGEKLQEKVVMLKYYQILMKILLI